MKQDQITSEILTLERKLSLLVGEHQKLKKAYEQSQAENMELRKLVKDKDDQLGDFRNELKINKIAGNINVAGESTEELKLKIDDYIKEIDKCILHLSR